MAAGEAMDTANLLRARAAELGARIVVSSQVIDGAAMKIATANVQRIELVASGAKTLHMGWR